VPNGINDENSVVGMITSPKLLGGISLGDGKVCDINTLLFPKEQQSVHFDEVVSLEGINNKGLMIGTIRTGQAKHAALLYTLNNKI
jgi:hypothetical protein